MNMQKSKIGIVGAGKVGSVLARGLFAKGYQLTGIASHTLGSASQLGKELGVTTTIRAADLMQDTEVLFITTPDRCIGEVVAEIAKDNGFKPGQMVFHTSGCLPVEILEPAKKQGAWIGCMHPLQSFSNRESTGERLAGIYFALTGQTEVIQEAEKIVKDLGGISFQLLDADKPLYHGAACIVSNYTVSLMHWASQLYGRFGLSSEEALAALLPLLAGTVQNIKEMGAVRGLTGPISRGDGITVKAHIEAFENEVDKNLYRMLGLYTLGIALEKGTVDEKQAADVEQILRNDNKKDRR
ncbi:MAG: protein of unknown function DUF2520-containing protein [Pelosinus sp.]|jgi:predicted short-subunit dehydrogenase-like oxidoreductase (DUF2520 family)|nr:protein of unknown function DUF2520-containing protein [Pelosinus sp.]